MKRLEYLDRVEQARGEGVEAVEAFGWLVYGKSCPAHVREWLGEIFANKRVGIVAPPESTKTTWISVILMAWWMGKHPDSMNLVVSVSDDQAQKAAAGVADTIEHNPRWRDVWPGVVPDKEKGWSRDGYYVKRGDVEYGEWQRRVADRIHPTLSAGGVGSALVIGKRVTGLLVSDDLHDVVSKTSDAVRDKTIEFFKTTLSSRPTAAAHMVTVGTRWHPKDVFAHLLATGLYKVFVHPALVEGESYWPQAWPVERLEEKRAELGSVDFRLMYLADPLAVQGRLLKGEWLVPFPEKDIDARWPMVYGIDFALTQLELLGNRSKDPDYFALAKMRIAPFGLVLADGLRVRCSQAESEELLKAHAALDGPKTIYTETNAAGQNFYQALLLSTSLPIVGAKAQKGKVPRIVTEMSKHFEFGRIRVSDALTPFLREFRDQWVSFGDKAVHDDTLDAAYWAWRAASYATWRSAEYGPAEPRAGGYVSPFARLDAAYRGL